MEHGLHAPGLDPECWGSGAERNNYHLNWKVFKIGGKFLLTEDKAVTWNNIRVRWETPSGCKQARQGTINLGVPRVERLTVLKLSGIAGCMRPVASRAAAVPKGPRTLPRCCVP